MQRQPDNIDDCLQRMEGIEQLCHDPIQRYKLLQVRVILRQVVDNLDTSEEVDRQRASYIDYLRVDDAL